MHEKFDKKSLPKSLPILFLETRSVNPPEPQVRWLLVPVFEGCIFASFLEEIVP
jgi:hypothetical protein